MTHASTLDLAIAAVVRLSGGTRDHAIAAPHIRAQARRLRLPGQSTEALIRKIRTGWHRQVIGTEIDEMADAVLRVASGR